nr:MAG TPA: hypothetical protein [Microviridae sp.]
MELRGDSMVYFRENLHWMCKLSGIYKTVLSELLGFNSKYLSALACGGSSPSLDCVVRIAHYFGVTVDYMLSKHDWSVYRTWPK